MRESIGYSVTINIVITFIVIIFAFLSSAIVYFKTNKASNILVDTIQKYEGYNKDAKKEIIKKLNTLGYGSHAIKCSAIGDTTSAHIANTIATCTYVDPDNASATNNSGYCVYRCVDKGYEDYYYYKIRINMMINIPVIGDVLDIPIYSNTDRMLDFEKSFEKVKG